MPASALDGRSALVLIDLQKGILGLPTAHPSASARAGLPAPYEPGVPDATYRLIGHAVAAAPLAVGKRT